MSGVAITCLGAGGYLVRSGPHTLFVYEQQDSWFVSVSMNPDDVFRFERHLDAYDFALYELNRLERKAA